MGYADAEENALTDMHATGEEAAKKCLTLKHIQ